LATGYCSQRPHPTRACSSPLRPLSSLPRDLSPGFIKKSIQFFITDSASFHCVAEGGEDLVEGAFAIHISRDEFLHITPNITAFSPGALFEQRFNFRFTFQSYGNVQAPWARRCFLHSAMF